MATSQGRQSAQPVRPGAPSRIDTFVYLAKVSGLRLQRASKNLLDRQAALPTRQPLDHILAEVRSPLYSIGNPLSKASSATEGKSVNLSLEFGKVQNLRRVAQLINGVTAGKEEEFSFWRQVGKCTKRRGFCPGRQVQEGCLIPAVGGGICQFTNSLYEAAIGAGLEVVERHRHTVSLPGSAAERGMDATVAWNHIDLRLKGTQRWQIAAHLTSTELVVQIRGDGPLWRRLPRYFASDRKREQAYLADPAAHACESCREDHCHVRSGLPGPSQAVTAVLVDGFSSEFQEFIAGIEGRRELFRPLNPKAFRRPAYRWNEEGFHRVFNATQTALLRAFRQRRLAKQGAERQRALIAGSAALALAYAARLTPETTHVVVAQTLLPHLWQLGVLGGRTFDVLLARDPMRLLQAKLDAAFDAHPERLLLRDFRAAPEFVDAETEALQAAERTVTAHRALAREFPNSLLMEWSPPESTSWKPGAAIAFPGPTVARKGAYEVREAAGRIGRPVVTLGSQLEGPDFWKGVERRAAEPADWLDGVAVVVQPAVIEDRPYRLLQALAAGCPVIATEACGLASHPLLTIIPAGDPDALVKALQAHLGSPSA